MKGEKAIRPSEPVEIHGIVKIILPEAKTAKSGIPSWRNYYIIQFPKEHRSFFPGYKIPFILETDIGEIETKVTAAPKGTEIGDPKAGWYIGEGLRPWYRRHVELKEGNKLIVKVIKPKERYRLSISE